MNRIPSVVALAESVRSISLAKAPTTQQIHDVCGKCAQMSADLLDGPVALALPVGVRIVREPVRARRAG